MKRKQLINCLMALRIPFDEKNSIRQLKELLNSRGVKSFQTERGQLLVSQNAEKKEEPAEIMFCDEIGKDPWTGQGISVNDIRAALESISPRGRPLNFLTDSPGGYVSAGKAIRNLLDQWPGKITNTIIGMAASAATWAIPADEVVAYKNSDLFIHRAFGMITVVGNADDMRDAINEEISDAIDQLETIDGQISDIYADQTGRSKVEMLKMMGAETRMTGEEAMEEGFVDRLIDGEAQNRFTDEQIDYMHQKLAALNSLRSATTGKPGTQGERNKPTNTEDTMKEKLIALLNKRGVTPPKDATEEQLLELLNTELAKVAKDSTAVGTAELQAQIDAIKSENKKLLDANTEAKRIRITNEVEKLITDDRIPGALKEKAINRCMADETALEEYRMLAPKTPGSEPVGVLCTEIANGDQASIKEVQSFVLDRTDKFMNRFIGKNADTYLGMDEYERARVRKEMAFNAKASAKAAKKHKNKIIDAWNTNNIDAGLQRQVIFTDLIEEFAIVLLPFETFSKKYENVPLEGTDEVDIPFYPLSTATANSWIAANGYAAGSFSSTTLNTRPIVIGGSGVSSGSSAAANTAKDRKWIGLSFSSYELRRQPYENWEQHAKLQGNALAVAIVTDVISRVVTNANYGASVKAVAAALFTANDVADLTESANGANWPTFGRWLVLDHRYLTPLLKDTTFKQYLSYGSTDPIRMAQIKAAYGFENVLIVPNLNTYSPAGENLFGWINHLYGVGVATAPIMPTEDVLTLMTRYDLITHPDIGLTLEHRRFGDLTLDQSRWTVECSYGAEKLRTSALKRITSQ